MVSVPVSVAFSAAPEAPPVKFAPVGAAHAYVVPDGNIVPVGEYVNGAVVQVLVLCDGILAAGFTVIVTVNTAPFVHVPDVGVTLKVAVVGFTVVLVSVLVTVAVPVLPDAPPVVPVPNVGVAHLYVVPVGIVPVGV